MTTEKTAAREQLEQDAKALNIRFNPKISDDRLNERIIDKRSGKSNPPVKETAKEEGGVTFTGPSPEDIANARVGNNDLPETLQERRTRLRKDSARLVRVRVTCMNPAKNKYTGEWIGAGNGLVGVFRKFVQFGVPWEIPYIIYQYLRDKEYQMWYTTTDARRNEIRKARQVKEFAIEVLPQLTPAEIEELAAEQKATNRIND